MNGRFGLRVSETQEFGAWNFLRQSGLRWGGGAGLMTFLLLSLPSSRPPPKVNQQVGGAGAWRELSSIFTFGDTPSRLSGGNKMTPFPWKSQPIKSKRRNKLCVQIC